MEGIGRSVQKVPTGLTRVLVPERGATSLTYVLRLPGKASVREHICDTSPCGRKFFLEPDLAVSEKTF